MKKDAIVSTEPLSNAIARMATNCLEGQIYTGALQKQLVASMTIGKDRIREYNPCDTVTLHCAVEMMFEDVRMLSENIKKADRPVEVDVIKGKEITLNTKTAT